jgi:hypothetical protein
VSQPASRHVILKIHGNYVTHGYGHTWTMSSIKAEEKEADSWSKLRKILIAGVVSGDPLSSLQYHIKDDVHGV